MCGSRSDCAALRLPHVNQTGAGSFESWGCKAVSAETVVQVPAFLRIHDVVRITALSRPTLYRRIAARRFPAPVHLGGRACGWPSMAIQSWISDPDGYRAPCGTDADTPRKRGRPRKYSV